MNKIEVKLETLKGLIEPLLKNASPGKKKYANDLFSDIITELNEAEIRVKNAESSLNGFIDKDQYLSEYHKALDILILLGAGDIPYNFLSKINMSWLLAHNDNQTRPFTFAQLYQMERMLRMFEGLEDRLPESGKELMDYFKDTQ